MCIGWASGHRPGRRQPVISISLNTISLNIIYRKMCLNYCQKSRFLRREVTVDVQVTSFEWNGTNMFECASGLRMRNKFGNWKAEALVGFHRQAWFIGEVWGVQNHCGVIPYSPVLEKKISEFPKKNRFISNAILCYILKSVLVRLNPEWWFYCERYYFSCRF